MRNCIKPRTKVPLAICGYCIGQRWVLLYLWSRKTLPVIFVMIVKLRYDVLISVRINELHSICHSRLRRHLSKLSLFLKRRPTRKGKLLWWFVNQPLERNLGDVRKVSNCLRKTLHKTSQLQMDSHLAPLSVAEDRPRTLFSMEEKLQVRNV